MMSEAAAEVQKESDKKQWYHTRQICWLIYRSNADPKTAAKTIDAWWSLGDNKEPKKARTSKAQQQKLLALIEKLNNK